MRGGRTLRCGLTAALLGCLGLSLAGCAATPARPAAPAGPTQAEQRQRLMSAEALCQQLAADPQLAPLRGRLMAPDPRQPWTREMMINQRRASEQDRALLVVMDERRAHCRQALLAASPGQTVPLFDYWSRQDAALVRLYNGETTIGDYNRAMADATAQFSIDVTNLQADVAARANHPDASAAPATTPRANAADMPVERFRALLPKP
jgi:hypothetical protein